MTIDYERLLDWAVPVSEQAITPRDAIFYALSVGLGHDPVDARQLRFVHEPDLLAMPTMGSVLAEPGFWMTDERTGVDWRHVVHGEQEIRLHRPIPVEGTFVGETKVREIADKGAGKGALVLQERRIYLKQTGDLVCTATVTTFCRADGGFGGPPALSRVPRPTPERPPDLTFDLPVPMQAALLFRLQGDRSPVHVDPAFARQVGFPMPILHGLCTFGMAGHAVLAACCDYRPEAVAAIGGRFSAPVYPGDTLRTQIWREGGHLSFRCVVPPREIVVLANGYVELQAGPSQQRL